MVKKQFQGQFVKTGYLAPDARIEMFATVAGILNESDHTETYPDTPLEAMDDSDGYKVIW